MDDEADGYRAGLAPASVRMTKLRVGEEQLLVVSYPLLPTVPRGLTLAEANVAQLIVAGRSNREIAALRGSRERTVANQVASVFRKLGVSSRSELIAALPRPAK